MDFFGPYGSIPTNCNNRANPCYKTVSTPYYNSYYTCNNEGGCPETEICYYRNLKIPSFITSNIPLLQTTQLHLYTDIALITRYIPNAPVSYTLDNKEMQTSKDTIPTTKTTVKITIDTHQKDDELFGPVNITLTESNTINTLTQNVIGTKQTIFNVVITYNSVIECAKSMCNTNNCNIPCNIDINKTICFKVISITISYN